MLLGLLRRTSGSTPTAPTSCLQQVIAHRVETITYYARSLKPRAVLVGLSFESDACIKRRKNATSSARRPMGASVEEKVVEDMVASRRADKSSR